MRRMRSTCSRIRAGFTLIELLVTIGIILIVVSLTIPVVSAAKRQAYRARSSQDIQAVSVALEAYKAITGYYPSVKTGGSNSYTSDGSLSASGNNASGGELYQALLVPFIGADGATYGPMVPTGALTAEIANHGTGNIGVMDHNGRAILYLPAHPGVDITTLQNAWDPIVHTSYAGAGQFAEYLGNPLWRLPHMVKSPSQPNDGNTTSMDLPSMAEWRYILGNRYNYPNQDGTCNPAHGDVPAITGPYILWCSGPSKRSAAYGPVNSKNYGLDRDRKNGNLLGTAGPSAANGWHGYTTDDVMNFTFAP